ncbi:MAG TPA: hypothetical protein VGJ64_00990 [Gemmatimonadaceae bacterium]
MMLFACTDRSALERQARAASTQQLIGTWDARFHLDRALMVSPDSASMKQEIHGQLAFLANRSVDRGYPTMNSPSAYGSFDVDFTPFGFDARSDDEPPTAVAGWLSADSLEIILGDPWSDVTVRMAGRVGGDSIVGGWRVLVARTGGGGGRFAMVRHR